MALFVQEQFGSGHRKEMQRCWKFFSKIEPTLCAFILLFVVGERVPRTHFEEEIIIGFGILAIPGNHICETAILYDYCPEWHFMVHANLID